MATANEILIFTAINGSEMAQDLVTNLIEEGLNHQRDPFSKNGAALKVVK